MSQDASDLRAPHLRHRDFLGAFGVLRRDQRILMTRNRRHIGGREVDTWDLPGGQVEPGELLEEALRRELDEETGLVVVGATPFLFLQEGEKLVDGRRTFAWRSFFFEVPEFTGDATPGDEVLELAWMDREELAAALTAPYHDSFQTWLRRGGAFHRSAWRESR